MVVLQGSVAALDPEPHRVSRTVLTPLDGTEAADLPYRGSAAMSLIESSVGSDSDPRAFASVDLDPVAAPLERRR